jgi:hypothetical protein
MHHASPLDSVIDRLIEVTVGASTEAGFISGAAVAGASSAGATREVAELAAAPAERWRLSRGRQ